MTTGGVTRRLPTKQAATARPGFNPNATALDAYHDLSEWVLEDAVVTRIR
jgi:hypothetical protein